MTYGRRSAGPVGRGNNLDHASAAVGTPGKRTLTEQMTAPVQLARRPGAEAGPGNLASGPDNQTPASGHAAGADAAPVPSMAPGVEAAAGAAGEGAGPVAPAGGEPMGDEHAGADPADGAADADGADAEAGGGEAEAGADAEAEKVHRIANAGVSGAGGPLPHLAAIQRSFGTDHDLSDVSAHVGGAAAQASESLGAHGYAIGDSVAFAGEPDLHLAAHEAAHVVQQRAGVQLKSGLGAPDDAYERQADAVADRVVAGRSAVDVLPSTGGGAGSGAVQRRLTVAGTLLDRAGATHTAEALVRGPLRDLSARPARAALVRETVRELAATSDMHTFNTLDVLGQNVRQRVLTSQYMRRSQGSTRSNMAFSYPNTRGDGTLGMGPKVNDAATSYWGAASGSPYAFDLTPAGRANAYEAIMALFVEHTQPRKRSLMHCDYVVSVIRARAYAETIGASEFNRLVSTGALPLRLRYDMFWVMQQPQGGGGRPAPLQSVTVGSESDLIVGDHVVFWNHPSYDPLIIGTHGVWRLENAIVIDRSGGELRYQGHGYFSPVNKDHLIRGMLHHYNIHVDEALAITRRIDRGRGAARTAAEAELATKFPRVARRAAGGWEIRGTGFGVPTVRELKHLTAAEAPGLINPANGRIEARRPVEAAL